MSTSIEASFSVIAEISRRMKTQKVHEFGDDPDESKADIMNFCVGVRAGKQLFLVYHGPGPLAARHCAYWSALFLSCDEIFQVADARYKSVTCEPLPEAPVPRSKEQEEEEFWRAHPELEPGMLGEAWERGDRDGIKECLQIARYPYIGTPTLATYNYERTGRKIVWGHVYQNPLDSHSGAIDDFVKEGFRRRRNEVQKAIDEILQEIHANMVKEGFDEKERPYWTDRGMAKMVSAMKHVFCVQYMSPYPGLPDVVFKDGNETDFDYI